MNNEILKQILNALDFLSRQIESGQIDLTEFREKLLSIYEKLN